LYTDSAKMGRYFWTDRFRAFGEPSPQYGRPVTALAIKASAMLAIATNPVPQLNPANSTGVI
jgi:hypothetical protein